MEPSKQDIESLIQEKYKGDRTANIESDLVRLRQGEPLAYVIGSMPFLGLSLSLASKPLIPRPETEWWTELLTQHIGTEPKKVLDLCAGSGAIGLGILKHCPHTTVSFGELVPEHAECIKKNVEENKLDATRVHIHTGNLFEPVANERYDVIATNPPYIPEGRELPESVTAYEPTTALYGGVDGLSLIRKIAKEAAKHLTPHGELWMECDIENIKEAKDAVLDGGASTARIRTDQYGRPRVLVAYYSHGTDDNVHT